MLRISNRMLAGALAVAAAATSLSAQPAPGAGAPRTEIPSTPLGAAATAFLDGVNGDTAAARRFVDSHLSPNAFRDKSAADFAALIRLVREQSGGLTVTRIMRENPLRIATEAKTGQWVGFEFTQDPAAEPGRTYGVFIRPFPPQDPPEAAWAKDSVDEAGAVREIDRQVSRLAALDRFSGVVLVARGDRIIYERAVGMANQDFAIPNDRDTRFHLGSMPKMFVAIGIAKLVEQGKLRFTDTLAAVLPQYPDREAAGRITIHHLLTHTAGLGDLFSSAAYDKRRLYGSNIALLPAVAAQGLEFDPGARFSYSNGGFVTLAAVIEAVSGESFDAFLAAHVFAPAGMTATGNARADELVAKRAVGYGRFDDDPLGVAPRRNNEHFLGRDGGNGAGGAYSTAPDLLRFARALRGNRLLSPEMTARLTTGAVNMSPDGRWQYGYGFMRRTIEGTTLTGHSGGGARSGINSALEMLWDKDVTVIVTGNYDAPAAQMLADDIARYLDTRMRR